MGREQEYSSQSVSPVKKYFKWNSDEKRFTYYDKESEKNIGLPLPVSFIHLKEMATIAGFDTRDNCGIYSNEISPAKLKTETLTVKNFKGKNIAKGIYGEIKGDIAASGGKFSMVVYALLKNELVGIKLVGSSFSAWYDFSNDNRSSFLGNLIEVKSYTDEKKGKTDYTKPTFTVGGVIPMDSKETADTAYDNLNDYLKQRGANSTEIELTPAEEVPAPKFADAPVAKEEDLLPF